MCECVGVCVCVLCDGGQGLIRNQCLLNGQYAHTHTLTRRLSQTYCGYYSMPESMGFSSAHSLGIFVHRNRHHATICCELFPFSPLFCNPPNTRPVCVYSWRLTFHESSPQLQRRVIYGRTGAWHDIKQIPTSIVEWWTPIIEMPESDDVLCFGLRAGYLTRVLADDLQSRFRPTYIRFGWWRYSTLFHIFVELQINAICI